jgi:transposase InsO family protein
VPWDPDQNPADERAAFIAAAGRRDCPFARLCRDFGITPKTGYKWLGRAAGPRPQPFRDRPRRPRRSPGQTPPAARRAILDVHDRYAWGARKIRAYLARGGEPVPSLGTVHNVLRRAGRTAARAAAPPPHRFERPVPNHLWQIDFKGPLAGPPRPRYLLSVIDDRSRYLVALRLCPDMTMATAWAALWEAFGEAGLPLAILSDNGFAPRGPAAGGLSWLEARLLRLDVRSIHGRPYHPQTQGKVERLHGTLERELLPGLDWARPDAEAAAAIGRWARDVYNAIRPHEALGQAAPASVWYPSDRPRPARLPEAVVPAGADRRKVMQRGEVSWRGYELMVGAGLTGEYVGVQERDGDVILTFGPHELRRLPRSALAKGRIV